ncbi:MAG: diguanylate cyclase [Candidatus Omnitrophota bacterium]
MEEKKYLDEIKSLKEELEKIRSQFYVFYELTQAMRTTLRLDEIAYIILTGLTAQQGLGFNRALLFLIDRPKNIIQGFMGIGPIDTEEANKIWSLIEDQKMDLYALIETYNRIKRGQIRHKLMELTRSLEFPLNEKAGLLYETLYEFIPMYIKADNKTYKNDPVVTKMRLNDFVIAPLVSKKEPLGTIIVDNYITKRPISEESIRILTMFISQAAGAIENSKTFEHTLNQAHKDTLTSLWNYGYFQYKLDEEIINAQTNKGAVSILMLDLDNFKNFNDAFGHQAGDEALKQIANTLQNLSRKRDVICRYGGEEFSLILPHTFKEEASSIAERIRRAVEQKEILGRFFTVSIGVSCFPGDADKKDGLIRKADLALYRAKGEGKNKVVIA